MISPDQIIKFVTYRLNDKRIDCWPDNLPNLSELIQRFQRVAVGEITCMFLGGSAYRLKITRS